MSEQRFPEVPGGYPFPRLEEEVLEYWESRKIFDKSLRQTREGPRFVFYEGPPTANNRPHVGHVVTRAVKDLFPRYRTMRGYRVDRKAGWDTHGLPVEIEVEKQLGFSGKRQIEEYGIEAFNRACLESVHTYEEQWRALSRRVGFWVDLDDAYYTYSNRYVESVWWALSELWKKGLLTQGYKIQPYCARCGTTLSSHEVAQNYQEAEDPSVWVLFPVRGDGRLTTVTGEQWKVPDGLRLVAWTTTPWTLLAHVGLAVNPDLVYRVVEDPRDPDRLLLFGDELETPVPLDVREEGQSRRLDLRELPPVARFRGKTLEGLAYDRPYETGEADREGGDGSFAPPPSDGDGWRVFAADYVTTAEGTGLVHTAPPFGEDDYRSGLRHGLPFFLTVDGEGRIVEKPGIEAFAGQGFKQADPAILADLRSRDLLLHGERYRHSYPFCWRCDHPLLYYATESWFVRTTEEDRRRALIRKNRREIAWHPEHIGEGRFGKWLENVVDWALSRRRYWGTPLPVWQCRDCQRTEVVGSYRELFEKAGRELPEDVYERRSFDPHRPFIDAVTWSCADCQGTMERVEDVIDAWFDSGSMPFAQHHYTGTATEDFDPGGEIGFPADFIAEAVDQTRGWFYTLHVLGVLLFDSVAYRTCIVLGHINDESGQKMSKRLGNVVDPMEVIPETGADALRWYFYVNNPELPGRFSDRLVREAAQSFLLPVWNALSFFTIYANLDGWAPGSEPVPLRERPPLDRWILLRLDRVVEETTEALEGYRIAEAARSIESFVEELTNWYIRRSRERFWAGAEERGDKESGYQSLYEVLVTLTRLMAPFTPFLAETLHRHLVRSQDGEAAESVHLEAWPEPMEERSEPLLERAMEAIQRIVRLGHAARNSHGLKTRQPLPAVTLVSADPGLEEAVAPYADLLRDELNVKEIVWAEDRSEYVRHEVRPVFPRCGPRFGKAMPRVQRALETADGDRLARELEETGRVRLGVGDEEVALSAEEVEVRLVEREGLATQGDRELLVALDATVTPELRREGLAREFVHRIQTARKEEDLDYADRIRIAYEAEGELEEAIAAHGSWIRRETLGVALEDVPTASDGDRRGSIEGMEYRLRIERVRQPNAP